MEEAHLTTLAEYWPGRSDCHAWSSWVAADFLTCVLGVKPVRPGFAEILIKPQPGSYQFARGSIPTPVGEVKVEWHRQPDSDRLCLKASVPRGVATRVELPDGRARAFAEGGRIEL